ncbi:hypothetical protein BD779DRAFT_1692954, partial [Infundibulicybe gibba]
LDVLFPSNPALTAALRSLETHYTRTHARLSDIVQHADTFVSAVETKSTLIALGLDAQDVWCIDPRGLLTLCVAKETYERLGLVGVPLPAAYHAAQYGASSHPRVSKERRDAALAGWDARRAQAWDVVYHSEGACAFACDRGDSARPPACDVDGVEDWNAEMGALFEWVGWRALARRDRLKAHDRVEPYVALYEPPAPAHVGALTHLRWTGLLPASFVQTVIDSALAAMGTGGPAFMSIASHGATSAPVGYVPAGESGVGLEGMLRTPCGCLTVRGRNLVHARGARGGHATGIRPSGEY